jgi:hypothetical protein
MEPLSPRGQAVLAAGCLALAAILLTDAVPILRGPAPWPPEWQWIRRTEPTSRAFLPVAAAAAALLGLLAVSERSPRLVTAAAVVAGAAWWWALAGLEPRGAPRTLARNILDSSYHRVAVATAGEGLRPFLASHADRLPTWEGRDRHAATHPPGPILFHRAALAAAGGDERRAALTSALVIAILAALTAVPLAALARAAGHPEASAARLAVLWACLPGPAALVGQLDPLLALPITASAACLAHALRGGGLGAGLAAGAFAGLAVHVSYGAVSFVAVGTVVAIAIVRPAREPLVRAGAAATAAGLLVAWAVPAALGHHVVQAALTALRIHRDVYTTPRSYPLWLAFNLLDLALFAGLPAVVLLALHARHVLLARVVVAALLLLDLTGTVRGEAGRIWTPLLPFVLVAAFPPAILSARAAVPAAALLLLLAVALRASWHVF